MGTTYGPSERSLRRGMAGRNALEPRVIPLNRSPLGDGDRGPRAVRQDDGAKLISWPLQPRSADGESLGPASRRRRRSWIARQWLPSAALIGVVATLILVLVAVRMMTAASSAQSTAVSSATTAALTDPASAASREASGALAQNPAPPVAAPTPSIRFNARPIEPSYTIVAGDNLWTIAQKNNTTAAAIQSINNLSDSATLSVGQKLVMP